MGKTVMRRYFISEIVFNSGRPLSQNLVLGCTVIIPWMGLMVEVKDQGPGWKNMKFEVCDE